MACSLASQHFWIARTWVWVPYTCYYHLYDKAALYSCAVKDDVKWIHAQGDSQEREFVSMLKTVNGSDATYTKYQAVRVLFLRWTTLRYLWFYNIVFANDVIWFLSPVNQLVYTGTLLKCGIIGR